MNPETLPGKILYKNCAVQYWLMLKCECIKRDVYVLEYMDKNGRITKTECDIKTIQNLNKHWKVL